MKVKIISCQSEYYWYNNLVGEIVESTCIAGAAGYVIPFSFLTQEHYERVQGRKEPYINGYIEESDCVLLSDFEDLIEDLKSEL